MVLSSGEMAAVSKSTFDLRIGLVKLKCFKEYNTQIITDLISNSNSFNNTPPRGLFSDIYKHDQGLKIKIDR